MGCAFGNTGAQPEFELDEGNIELRYSFGRRIGHGATAEVFECEYMGSELGPEGGTGEAFAIKVMTKEGDVHELGEMWKNECDILEVLEHPNIVKILEHRNQLDAFYIITIMYTGSLLFDAIAGDDVFTETLAANYVKCMLEINQYLNDMNVVHRDLKPENYIFAQRKPGADLILLDFGVAKIVEDKKKYTDFALGTPLYMSPELARAIMMQKKSITGAVLKTNDLWAVGVMAFVMLTGHQPFREARTSIETFGAVMNEKIQIPAEARLSDPCVDFLIKMLTRDQKRRLNLQEALNHEWLNGGADKEIHTNNLKALRQFSHQTRLKKAIISLLVEQTSPTSKKMQKMKSHFKRLDAGGTGKLDQKALTEFLKTQGFSEEDAKWEAVRLISESDRDNTGYISFEEFCHQFQRKEIKFNERYRRMVFDILDADKSGFIEKNELLPLLERMGDKTTAAQVIAEVDENRDSKLSFKEFESAMKEEVPDTSPSLKHVHSCPVLQKIIHHDLWQDGIIFQDFSSETRIQGLPYRRTEMNVMDKKTSPAKRRASAPMTPHSSPSLKGLKG